MSLIKMRLISISIIIVSLMIFPSILMLIPNAKASPFGDWGNWYPQLEDSTKLTNADIRIVPNGYQYKGLWQQFPDAGEECYQDIDDTYIIDSAEPYAETYDDYMWTGDNIAGIGIRQAAFYMGDITEFGTGHYEILVSFIVKATATTDWWIGANDKWSDAISVTLGVSWQDKWAEFSHSGTGNFWTTDEINNLVISVMLDITDTTVDYGFGLTQLSVLIRDVTPVEGVLILRPDSDQAETIYGGSPDFDRWPVSSPNNYSLLNETTEYSDEHTTFVTANTSYDLQQQICGLTDLTNRPEGESYGIILWIIARCTIFKNWEEPSARLVFGLRGYSTTWADSWVLEQEEFSPSIAWMNYTLELPLNPITGGSWTEAELNNLYSSVTVWDALETNNAIQISQIAVLVYITNYTEGYYGEIQDLQATSMIWLLILFLPALAIAQVAGKIGFVGGMIIMLLVLGTTQTGFFSVMIFGMIAVGVMVYKGEE